MNNIWIEDYPYAAIEWYDGNYVDTITGNSYRFNLCSDDGNLSLEFIDDVPEDRIKAEKEIFDEYNRKFN